MYLDISVVEAIVLVASGAIILTIILGFFALLNDWLTRREIARLREERRSIPKESREDQR